MGRLRRLRRRAVRGERCARRRREGAAPVARSRAAPSPAASAQCRRPASPCASNSRATRPRSITAMRSATSSTRSRFCSTISTAKPCAARRRSASGRSPGRSTAGCLRRARRAADPRVRDQRTCQREDLLLAARQRAAAPVEQRRSSGNMPTTRSTASCSVSPVSPLQARRRFSSVVSPGRMPRPCGT